MIFEFLLKDPSSTMFRSLLTLSSINSTAAQTLALQRFVFWDSFLNDLQIDKEMELEWRREEERAAAWLFWDSWSVDSDGHCRPVDSSAEPPSVFDEVREIRLALFYRSASETISRFPLHRVIEDDDGPQVVHAFHLAASTPAIDFL